MADPQTNPNALGAPTEGFGQTVSFAFDPRGVTPALQLPKSEPRAMGMGNTSHGPLSNPNEAFQPVKQDGTAEFLMKLGQDILAPKVEEARNQKFVEGIQRAMQGQAVKDMAEQQPWYSRIFGDTPMMEGARAYEVSTKVNEVVSKETANIENVKHLGAKDAATYYAGVIKNTMTGDANTDALVSKHLIDAMPGLMKAQAKAYYGYNQKRAMDALSSNVGTSFDALQQAGEAYSKDVISEDDMNVRRRATIASIRPPEGINEENYAKVMAANLRAAAEKGQFHAIEAVRQAGGFSVMTDEQRNAVEKAIETAGVRHRDRYAFQFVREIAELRSDAAHPPAGMTPAQIAERYQTMNSAYQKLTGSPVGLFSSDEMANGATGTINAIKAEEAEAIKRQAVIASRDATLAQKQAALAGQKIAVDSAIASGDILQAKVRTKASNDELDTAFFDAVKNGPAKSGDFIIRQNFIKGGYVNPLLKQEWLSKLRASEGLDAPSDDFYKALQTYQTMKEGTGSTALADAYFGEYAPKLERFMRMTDGAPDGSMDPRAYRAAMDPSPVSKPKPLDHKEAAALAKTVSGKLNSVLPRWLGGRVNLRDDTIGALADVAKVNIEDWRGVPGMPDEEAVARGISGAVASKRLELLGGFAIDRANVDAKLPTLRELASGNVNVPAGSEDKYFEAFLHGKGFDKGATSLHYVGKGTDGSMRFVGTVSHDGETKLIQFTDTEWRAYAGKATLTDTAKPEKPWYVMGPEITYKVDPKTPGIYADRKRWAEYRAQQEAASRKRMASTQPE